MHGCIGERRQSERERVILRQPAVMHLFPPAATFQYKSL